MTSGGVDFAHRLHASGIASLRARRHRRPFPPGNNGVWSFTLGPGAPHLPQTASPAPKRGPFEGRGHERPARDGDRWRARRSMTSNTRRCTGPSRVANGLCRRSLTSDDTPLSGADVRCARPFPRLFRVEPSKLAPDRPERGPLPGGTTMSAVALPTPPGIRCCGCRAPVPTRSPVDSPSPRTHVRSKRRGVHLEKTLPDRAHSYEHLREKQHPKRRMPEGLVLSPNCRLSPPRLTPRYAYIWGGVRWRSRGRAY